MTAGREQTFRPLGPVVRADEAVAWFSAEARLAHAQQRSDEIMARAQAAFEDERRRGFEAGRDAGVQEAIRLVAETKAAADGFILRLHGDLVELVVAIVQQILDRYEPNELTAMAVAKALQHVRAGSALTLLTGPDEAEAVRERLAVMLPDPAVLQVAPDERIAPRRCVLWSEFGQIELSVDVQLQQLAAALRSSLEEATP